MLKFFLNFLVFSQFYPLERVGIQMYEIFWVPFFKSLNSNRVTQQDEAIFTKISGQTQAFIQALKQALYLFYTKVHKSQFSVSPYKYKYKTKVQPLYGFVLYSVDLWYSLFSIAISQGKFDRLMASYDHFHSRSLSRRGTISWKSLLESRV